ncbi:MULTISPECIES: metallophosphoesterase [unclassified Cyanobium]|uniref:metallophosphoesterase family protein n=1 Tax=unclassified Cyanobium TaxID=2627006 RepID=UPI0020CC62BD|nr:MULTISPECIES: metallophosphoesterase [unclassified Cyanobium]MCP9834844.1 metallophosphoesterase [Cyanobium sp. La Preciosa 7G6]MCP9937532.1 metallophosphoesterase [Cyanobium sp. Aljojuca 7A6]
MPPSLGRRQLLSLSGLALGAGLWQLWQPAAARGATALAAPPRGGTRLVLISDLNSSYGSTTYVAEVHRGVAQIPSLRPDLVICAGDMVAGQKAGLGRQRLAAMWASFERSVLSPLRRAGLPFAPAMGNHDASGASASGRFLFADDRAEAARFWNARRDALGLSFVDTGNFPFHYAIRQDDVFVLVWDASTAQVPAEQLRWAERILASPAARSASRRLVVGHLPLRAVSQGRDRPGEVLARSAALQQLLERHGVEAYVSGHQHAYFPARLGQLDLFQLGAMGSGPRRLLGQNAPPFQTLTVLDLVGSPPRLVDTSFDLRTLRRIDPQRLPRSLSDAAGRVLQRRPSA